MSAFKTDDSLTTAARHGTWRKSFPIPGDNTSFIVEEDVMVLFANFTPLALNTAHGTFATAYLVSESPLEDLGGGVARYTRTYAQIPASRDEFPTMTVDFPGLKGAANPPYDQYWVVSDDGCDPKSESVTVRVRYDYFLCAAGQTFATPDDITLYPKQPFTLVGNDNVVVTHLLPAGVYWSDSVPTKEDWISLKAGGGGIGTGANAGEFIAEKSKIERYMGNIYFRMTTYAKAQ